VSKRSFTLGCKASNLSHNHPLSSQLTIVDGRSIVSLENMLTPEGFQSIKDQSLSCVQVPQIHVNREENFPDCSFTSSMLYQMRERFLKDKYGANGHNLPYLFMKGDRVWCLDGSFLVVASSTDFSIDTIHCQTQLMVEYARMYGLDGLKMADGTHKITKYDMNFVFWVVINCLLRSKFVGYTANFTENADVINAGADVFFKQKLSNTSGVVKNNKILVGGILEYFDAFIDNKIVLNADGEHEPLAAFDCINAKSDASTSMYKGSGFMTDEGTAFPLIAEHFGWTHLLDHRHLPQKYLLLGKASLILSNSNQMVITF
jgi:hypothetical protein